MTSFISRKERLAALWELGVYVLKIKLGALHMVGECFPTGQQPLLYFSVYGLLKLIFAKILYCL